MAQTAAATQHSVVKLELGCHGASLHSRHTRAGEACAAPGSAGGSIGPAAGMSGAPAAGRATSAAGPVMSAEGLVRPASQQQAA